MVPPSLRFVPPFPPFLSLSFNSTCLDSFSSSSSLSVSVSGSPLSLSLSLSVSLHLSVHYVNGALGYV